MPPSPSPRTNRSPSPSSPTAASQQRNALYLAPVLRCAARCHRLQEALNVALSRGSAEGAEGIETAERALLSEQHSLIRQCCDAALGVLLRGRATWADPSYAVRPSDVDEARRLIELADVTLRDFRVARHHSEGVAAAKALLLRGGVGGATAVEDVVAKGARHLVACWPLILVHTTACTVFFHSAGGGSPRAAAQRAAAAWALVQASVVEDPSCLVMACLAAGGGHYAVAEQVIAAMTSYAAVLSALCRLDEALRFAQLGAALSQQLHSELMARAAHAAAMGCVPPAHASAHAVDGHSPCPQRPPQPQAVGHGAHDSVAEISCISHVGPPPPPPLDEGGVGTSLLSSSSHSNPPPSAPPAFFDATNGSFIQSPSILAGRTPTALLTAIALHNCVCVMRRVREQSSLPCIAEHPRRRYILDEECSDARQIYFLEIALDLAVAELGSYEVEVAGRMQQQQQHQNDGGGGGAPSAFVTLGAGVGPLSRKEGTALRNGQPRTFVQLLQQKLSALRGPSLGGGEASAGGYAPDRNSIGVASASLSSHRGRVATLDSVLRQRRADVGEGQRGPHSAFSPSPRRNGVSPSGGARVGAQYSVGRRSASRGGGGRRAPSASPQWNA